MRPAGTMMPNSDRRESIPSFKPNLFRSTKHMAEKACHVFGSATQVGLTQALGSRMTTWDERLTFWIALGGFGTYFGVMLIPKIYPAFGGSSGAFLLAMSLLLVAPAVLLLVGWSVGAVLVSRVRKKPLGKTSRAIGHVAFAAVLCFAAFSIASYFIAGSLPSGSHLSAFDRSLWLDPRSAEYVEGDITPRQKMLADVVAKLPGRNRDELERMLGASPETGYFQSSGRDLIYATGPQRDSLFAIDSEWLLIWLDDMGRFERYAIVSD